MKLRTFILLMSATLILVLTGIFSFQVKHTLSAAFDELNALYQNDMQDVTASVLSAKSNYLRNFGKLLESNYDLSGIYVVSRESKDAQLISEQLQRIKDRSGFDLVDILPLNSSHSLLGLFSIQEAALPAILQNRKGITTLKEKEDLVLASITPLKLYDETVGYVVLGYFLNETIAKEVASTAHIQAIFSETSSASAKETGLFNPAGSPVKMQITVLHPFLNERNRRLGENLLLFGALFLIVLGSLIYFFLEFGFIRHLRSQMGVINKAAQGLREGHLPEKRLHSHPIEEVNQIAESFNQFASSLVAYDGHSKEHARLAAEAQQQAALTEVAQKLAHDIRSPLSALDMLITSMDEIPAEGRSLVRGAIQRIHDIAASLLEQTRAAFSAATDARIAVPTRFLGPLSLHSLVEPLLSEKRVQYRHRPDLEITSRLSSEGYGLFLGVDPSEFRAVLSNLIDNAVEATQGRNRIEITGLRDGASALITVTDSGRGISEDILPQLGRRGATFGKGQGSGLGLYHAFNFAKTAEGSVEIHSSPGNGTRIELRLPAVTPPDWFLAEVRIQTASTVVILDDELPIHHFWAGRLFALGIQENQIQLLHLTSAKELRAWAETRKSSEQALLLCDYDLRGSDSHGIALIEELGLKDISVLVTGRYDDETVLAACRKIGLKLLPKTLAGAIPLRVV